MTLYQLFDGIQSDLPVGDVEIRNITCDSRQVEEGCLFFCMAGSRVDGHDHGAEALEKGAAAIVAQRDLGLPSQVLVPDTRRAYGLACANWFGNPAKKLKLIGVTGTNGKTTTTYLVKQILEKCGKTVGLIGTIHNEISDLTLPAKHTTPEPMQLHTLFARMVRAGCEYVIMEVSSHALDQSRVEGCRFDCGIFTNLTQDHLDYHKDMEGYYQAKKKLFDQCEKAVINGDDDYGQRLLKEVACPVGSYSCQSDEADYTARDIKISASGSRFMMLSSGHIARVSIPMPGMFSVANAMAAAVACIELGLDFTQVAQALGGCTGVTGRIEVLPTNTPYTVIRDYAHSPDGLEKVFTAIREFATGRVVALFGCAGNRDRTKRSKMGEAVARLADYCILTSDNPRDEDPLQIIDDALPGLKAHKTPYKVIPDRYEAIRWALDFCQPDDILVLAGKGHEDYQVLDYGTIYFDEKEIVLGLLEQQENKRGNGP